MASTECEICKEISLSTGKPENLNSRVGLLAAGLVGLAGVGITVISVPFLVPAFRRFCLPYIPATDQQVQNVINVLKAQVASPKSKVIDLGSGDGRLVIHAAKAGFQAVGVELNPWLVAYSKVKARLVGVNHLTSFHCQDLWKVNLQDYKNVIIFGVQEMMPDLEKKFLKELSPNAKVIACRFQLPMTPVKHSVGHGIDTVWIYDFNTTLKT